MKRTRAGACLVWTDEEHRLLLDHMNLDADEIRRILVDHGYSRSRKAILNKRTEHLRAARRARGLLPRCRLANRIISRPIPERYRIAALCAVVDHVAGKWPGRTADQIATGVLRAVATGSVQMHIQTQADESIRVRFVA